MKRGRRTALQQHFEVCSRALWIGEIGAPVLPRDEVGERVAIRIDQQAAVHLSGDPQARGRFGQGRRQSPQHVAGDVSNSQGILLGMPRGEPGDS